MIDDMVMAAGFSAVDVANMCGGIGSVMVVFGWLDIDSVVDGIIDVVANGGVVLASF